MVPELNYHVVLVFRPTWHEERRPSLRSARGLCGGHSQVLFWWPEASLSLQVSHLVSASNIFMSNTTFLSFGGY